MKVTAVVLSVIVLVTYLVGRGMSASDRPGKRAASDLLTALAFGLCCLLGWLLPQKGPLYPIAFLVAAVIAMFHAVRGAIRLVTAKKSQSKNAAS